MSKLENKKIWKFIVYPLIMVLINLLLVKFIMNNYLSHMDVESVLSNEAINFETNIDSVFVESNNLENGTISKNKIEFPKINTQYGKIEIESAEMSAPLIFGDGMNVLKEGVGQYHGSYIPGYGGTILLTGHNNMYPKVEQVKTGDVIKITTSYGVYKYKVNNIQILDKNEYSNLKLSDDKEQLIYYTCYPFTALGDMSKRYFVFADYVSGPKIIK